MSTDGGNQLLPGVTDAARRASREVVSLVRAAAFWIAALLPLSYLPLLAGASTSIGGVTKLVLLNVVAVLVGHGYRSSDDRDDRQRHESDDRRSSTDPRGHDSSDNGGDAEIPAAD